MGIALEIGIGLVALGAAFGLLRLPNLRQSGLVAIACVAVILLGFNQPVLAGAVKGDALTSDQKELNETLQTEPKGDQYQGIEYSDVKGTSLSDQDITERVKDKTPKGLKISVSNGSVRLSGSVSNRDSAQAIIDDVKEIPGVHEVAYDLGLKG